MSLLHRFNRDEGGSTAIEYAMIAMVVSIAILTGVQALSVTLGDIFTMVSDAFPK